MVKLEDVAKESLTKILALKTFDQGCLENLTHLKLHGNGVYGKEFISTLYKYCKHITHLCFNDCATRYVCDQGYGNIDQEVLEELSKFPLIRVKFALIRFRCTSFRPFLLKCQPKLQEISFEDCKGCAGVVGDIAATCKNLTSFGYGSLDQLQPQTHVLVALLHSNPNIKEFNIRRIGTPMNVDILIALMQLNHLETISFEHRTNRSNSIENYNNHFFGLLNRFRNLKSLDLMCCKLQQVSNCFLISKTRLSKNGYSSIK